MAVDPGGGSSGGGSTTRPPREKRSTASNPPTSRPAGSVSGGSMVAAFAAQYAGVRNVKATYLGKDQYGNSLYRFTYTFGVGNATANRTLAVSRSSSGGWNFAAPGSAAQRQPDAIPGTDQADFSGGNRQELLERAVGKVGELLERGLINEEQARTLIQGFSNWDNHALTMWISSAGRRANPNFMESGGAGAEEELGNDLFTGDLPGGGGGGGGGGFGGGGGGGGGGILGPIYVEPDKRVVRDYVKGTLVSLVGSVPTHLLDGGVEKYMKDHRAAFDLQTNAQLTGKGFAEIDPQMSVVEFIRNSREYQTIHKLRPDSVDEESWVADRAEQAIQGGIANSRVEDFAITQATAGADIQDVAEAAATAEFQATGQMPTLLDNQLRQITQAMFSRVGR